MPSKTTEPSRSSRRQTTRLLSHRRRFQPKARFAVADRLQRQRMHAAYLRPQQNSARNALCTLLRPLQRCLSDRRREEQRRVQTGPSPRGEVQARNRPSAAASVLLQWAAEEDAAPGEAKNEKPQPIAAAAGKLDANPRVLYPARHGGRDAKRTGIHVNCLAVPLFPQHDSFSEERLHQPSCVH